MQCIGKFEISDCTSTQSKRKGKYDNYNKLRKATSSTENDSKSEVNDQFYIQLICRSSVENTQAYIPI